MPTSMPSSMPTGQPTSRHSARPLHAKTSGTYSTYVHTFSLYVQYAYWPSPLLPYLSLISPFLFCTYWISFQPSSLPSPLRWRTQHYNLNFNLTISSTSCHYPTSFIRGRHCRHRHRCPRTVCHRCWSAHTSKQQKEKQFFIVEKSLRTRIWRG